MNLDSPNLVSLPPQFQTVQCKPLFFDLSNQTADWQPDLTERTQKVGAVGAVTGMLKNLTGFWG